MQLLLGRSLISSALLLQLLQHLIRVVIVDLRLVAVCLVELHLEAVGVRHSEHGHDADEGRRSRPEPVGCADRGTAKFVKRQPGFREGTRKILVRKFEDVAYAVLISWEAAADEALMAVNWSVMERSDLKRCSKWHLFTVLPAFLRTLGNRT